MNQVRTDYARLEDQIDWFDRNSGRHQAWYRWLKVVSIGAAALVPLASSIDGLALAAGLLGVVVVIAEGLQHINQHHENWIRYRATCEGLRHEKYLYLARSLHYDGCSDDEAYKLLVARVEALLSQEGNDWLSMRRQLDERRDA
jgi:hypothetical protein